MSAPEKKCGPDRELWKSIARSGCFPAGSEAGVAYQMAHGGLGAIPIDCVSSRLLRLVASARENKPPFVPPDIRQYIVEASHKAALRSATKAGGGMNFGILEAGPTLFEVRCEFIRLFVPNGKWPKDWSRETIKGFKHPLFSTRQGFEKMLRRLKLPLRRDSVGRPRKCNPNNCAKLRINA